jgi:hypothetical protein
MVRSMCELMKPFIRKNEFPEAVQFCCLEKEK